MQNPLVKLNFVAIIFELLYIIEDTYIESQLSPYICQYITCNCHMPFLPGFFSRTNAVNDYCALSRLYPVLLSQNYRRKKRLTRQRSIWRRLLSLNKKFFRSSLFAVPYIGPEIVFAILQTPIEVGKRQPLFP